MPLDGWVFAPTRRLGVLFVTMLQPTTRDTNFFLAGVLYGAMRCCGEHEAQPGPPQTSESRAIWERDGPITPAAIKDVHDMRCAHPGRWICPCCCWLPATEDWPKISYSNYDLLALLHHVKNPHPQLYFDSVP